MVKKILKNRLFDVVMPLLPRHDLSHWVGKLAHQPLPSPLSRLSVQAFAHAYNINMDEAEHPLEHYQSIGALFTRRLKPGVRPIGENIVHPADGVVTQAERINGETLIQAKGKNFTVTELLRSSHFAPEFQNGSYLTYYLCPTDYHRVHSPVDGKVIWSCHVPGELWPVNDWSVEAVEQLFVSNERVVTLIETAKGIVAVVMVAATNVGNITMLYDEAICTNTRQKERHAREKSYLPSKEIHRGDELGIFHMGSTVIMLLPPSMSDVDITKWRQKPVRMGSSL